MADGTALNVLLTANFKQLEKDLKAAGLVAEKSVSDIEQKFAKANPTLSAGFAGGLAGGLIAGAISQVGQLIDKLAEANKQLVELGDTSKRSGVDTGKLQELQFAGGNQGISAASTLKAVDDIGRSIDKATQSETEFGRLLEANGIKLKDSKGAVIETAVAFEKLADLVANAKTEYQKEQILAIAGVSKDLVPLFEQGADAIRRQGDEAKATGNIISLEMIERAKDFEDKWNESVTSFKTVMLSGIGEILAELEKIIAFGGKLVGLIPPELIAFLKNGTQGISSPSKALGLPDAPPKAEEPRPLTISKKTTNLPTKKESGGGVSNALTDEERNYNNVVRYIEQLEKTGRILEAERATLGLSNAERAKAVELARLGATPDAEQLALIEKQLAANERNREAIEKTNLAIKGTRDAAQFAGDQLAGAFDSLLDGGKIEDAINGITRALAKAAIQAALLGQGPLAGLLGTAGGSATGGIGGLIGSLLPGRASGGPVQAGKAYMVGENGPEMVRFGRNGNVTPNAVLGGRGGSSAPVNVVVNNTNGSQVGTQETRGPGGSRQIEIMIENAVAKSISSNGGVAQALQGRYGLNRSGGRR